MLERLSRHFMTYTANDTPSLGEPNPLSWSLTAFGVRSRAPLPTPRRRSTDTRSDPPITSCKVESAWKRSSSDVTPCGPERAWRVPSSSRRRVRPATYRPVGLPRLTRMETYDFRGEANGRATGGQNRSGPRDLRGTDAQFRRNRPRDEHELDPLSVLAGDPGGGGRFHRLIGPSRPGDGAGGEHPAAFELYTARVCGLPSDVRCARVRG